MVRRRNKTGINAKIRANRITAVRHWVFLTQTRIKIGDRQTDRRVQMSDTCKDTKIQTDRLADRQTDRQTGGSSSNQGQHLSCFPPAWHGSEQGTLCQIHLLFPLLLCHLLLLFLPLFSFPPSLSFLFVFISPLVFLSGISFSPLCQRCVPTSQGAVPTLVWWSWGCALFVYVCARWCVQTGLFRAEGRRKRMFVGLHPMWSASHQCDLSYF